MILRGLVIPGSCNLENRFVSISSHDMDIDKELSISLTMAEIPESTRGQAYMGYMSEAPESKRKEKKKAWEPSSNIESDKQLLICCITCTI